MRFCVLYCEPPSQAPDLLLNLEYFCQKFKKGDRTFQGQQGGGDKLSLPVHLSARTGNKNKFSKLMNLKFIFQSPLKYCTVILKFWCTVLGLYLQVKVFIYRNLIFYSVQHCCLPDIPHKNLLSAIRTHTFFFHII